jgi:hypothetical protein
MVAPRKAFDFSLKGATATQNNRVQKFCRFLKEAELLEECTYQPKPEYNFKLKPTGKEQKYLSGAWLENYVKQEVARLAQPFVLKSGQPYEVQPNLEISFKDNSKAELDLLFAVGQRVYCVEAKTHSSPKIIQTSLNRIEGLGLDKRAILIVVTDKSEEECLKLSQVLGNIRIACLPTLEKTVNAWLEAVL